MSTGEIIGESELVSTQLYCSHKIAIGIVRKIHLAIAKAFQLLITM